MNYDKRSEYNTCIRPLLDQLVDICNELHIPWVASFQVAVNSNGYAMATTAQSCDNEPQTSLIAAYLVLDNEMAALSTIACAMSTDSIPAGPVVD